MGGIIESVPNVSEGRRRDVIEAIAEAFGAPAGTHLLDVSSDPSHNRTVLTAIGDARALEESSLNLYEASLGRIDLRSHQGQHPRMGAVDVLPFVPLPGATMAECIRLARRVAERVGSRFDLPVFLYEDAAQQKGRSDLALIRQGQFEGLAAKLRDPFWKPDFGPAHPHASAGASAVGARKVLIAFNVELATDRIEIAKAIAKSVRASSGGLPGVKALGLYLADRHRAQVSMSLTDYRTTSMLEVFERIGSEAERLGAEVVRSEIVGLVPLDALPEDPVHSLKLLEFTEEKVLEVSARRKLGDETPFERRPGSPD
ncbi:MAG: glutamate formimidoyltransferase [Vicinamibacteria bacterium]